MVPKSKYDISCFGEFTDKALEKEFFCYDMKYYSKFIGPVAIIFGVIYMLFLFSDYFAVESVFSFMFMLFIRTLYLSVSIVLYFIMKQIKDYSNLAYLITAYEIWAIISFMMIIYQYGSISFMSFFSLMAMTLAIYITPNKLINSQIVSVFLTCPFTCFSLIM
jgi:hypothetical protein